MELTNKTLNKVAKITVYFWIMKVLATTLGEILGDFFSMTLNLGYIVSLGITVAFLAIVLAIQLKSDQFRAPYYWLTIVGTTTVGTEISDLMDRTLGLGYIMGSLLLFGGLLLVLFFWYKNEGKIEVYPIANRRVESFYWVAILFSNSLGTAFGDYLSDTIGLSYLTGAAITAGNIGPVTDAVIAVTVLPGEIALTRMPLGASSFATDLVSPITAALLAP